MIPAAAAHTLHNRIVPSGALRCTRPLMSQSGWSGGVRHTACPHLHFERHTSPGWSCSVMADPMLSHNASSSGSGGGGGGSYPAPTSRTVYLSKLRHGQTDSDSVWYLQDVLNRHPLTNGQTLPLTGNYLTETDEEVRLCQAQHFGWGPDPVGGSQQ